MLSIARAVEAPVMRLEAVRVVPLALFAAVFASPRSSSPRSGEESARVGDCRFGFGQEHLDDVRRGQKAANKPCALSADDNKVLQPAFGRRARDSVAATVGSVRTSSRRRCHLSVNSVRRARKHVP